MRVEILSCNNKCFDLLHNGTANSELVVGSMVSAGRLLEVERNQQSKQKIFLLFYEFKNLLFLQVEELNKLLCWVEMWMWM